MASKAKAAPVRWGDEAVRDEFKPSRTEGAPDASGVRTVVEYRIRDDGKKEIVTKRVRTIVTETRHYTGVAERRKWAKFGVAEHERAVDSPTTQSFEEVRIEPPDADMMQEKVASQVALGAAAALQRRKGNSFWEQKRANIGYKAVETEGEDGGGGGGGGGTAYVAPGLRRGAGGAGSSMSAGTTRDDSCTLRVTNISLDATEQDMRDLFERAGRLARVYMAKKDEGGVQRPRGFAFISYYNKADAQNGIDMLNGHGYDHLILKVEWAKPSGKEGGGAPREGGLAGGFTSGYGKALPQGKG